MLVDYDFDKINPQSLGVKGLSPLQGVGRSPTKKHFKHVDFLSLKQHTKQVSPPKVAIRSEQPLADCFISDGSKPHLRAAAGIYADALADELVR